MKILTEVELEAVTGGGDMPTGGALAPGEIPSTDAPAPGELGTPGRIGHMDTMG